MAEAKSPEVKTTRRIVRLAATDVKGDLSVIRALREIKGVSFMFAHSVCVMTGVDKKKKIGDISENDIHTMENFIKNPELPKWMLNRRKDPETGEDGHIIMANLDLKKREDINQMRKMRSYRGIRHEQGQPVRGQRTRSTFRTQKSVGVSRKKIQEAAKPKAAAPAEKK